MPKVARNALFLLMLLLSYTQVANSGTLRLAYDAGFGGAESLDPLFSNPVLFYDSDFIQSISQANARRQSRPGSGNLLGRFS